MKRKVIMTESQLRELKKFMRLRKQKNKRKTISESRFGRRRRFLNEAKGKDKVTFDVSVFEDEFKPDSMKYIGKEKFEDIDDLAYYYNYKRKYSDFYIFGFFGATVNINIDSKKFKEDFPYGCNFRFVYESVRDYTGPFLRYLEDTPEDDMFDGEIEELLEEYNAKTYTDQIMKEIYMAVEEAIDNHIKDLVADNLKDSFESIADQLGLL